MKKTIITLVFAIGMIATTFGQTVIIREIVKIQSSSGGTTSGLYITNEFGETSFVEYENKALHKSIGGNTKLFQIELNKYFDQGYKIVNSTSGGGGANNALILTTYILKKD